MKKLFKKSIACLIAVLMVVSALPFSPLSSPIEANAAEVKTNIDVWDASRARTNSNTGQFRYSYADSNTGKTLSGIQWDGLTHNSTYLTVNNTALSFAEISTAGAITGNDNIADLGISGDKWSFSAKFAYTGSSTKTTVFGLASTTKRQYTHSNSGANNAGGTVISNGYVADLVDIRADGTVYIGNKWNENEVVSGISSSDLASSSATDTKILTVTYDNGNLTIDINGTQKISKTVDTALFSAGVGNYLAGPNVQVYSGGDAPYYQVTSGGAYLYNMNLYSLSGATYEETGSTIPAEVQLKNAMKAFEDKFDGTKVYSNIQPAYKAYVDANTALNNACKTGSDAGLSTAATNLEKAMKNMTAWSAYTGTKHGSFANDNNNNSEAEYARTYTNVLWANSGISTVHSTGGDTVAKNVGPFGSRSDYVAQVKFYYDDTTLLFDGTNTAQFPVMMSVHGNKKPWTWNWDNLRIHFAMISSNGMQFKEKWHGTDSRLNCQWILLSKDTTNVQIIESTSSNFNGAKDKYFANELQLKEDLSNNPNITIEYKPTIKYNVGYDERNLTVEYTPSATIRVLNYKKVVTAINDNKSKLNNIANYKQGGLSTLVAAFDKATKNPNSFFTSSNDYSTCQTNYQNALNNITASPTADSAQTIQHSDASYNWTVTKEATCSEAGLKDGVCKFCGEEVKNVEIEKLPHTWREDKEVPATCTTTGTYAGKTCTVCLVTEGYGEIPAKGHNFTVYEKLNADSHTVKCSRDCGEEGSTYNEEHSIENGECTKCHYIAKVTIRFVDENDGFISSAEYNIGADVVVPELPEQTEVYVGDNQHKVTTYSWNEIPQATASQAATYKRVKTESTVACSNELMQKYETYDTWHCTVCRHEYNRDVTDMSALKANIKALETAVNVDDAAYKYDASALATAKEKLDEAKAYVANDNNRYASIQDVNAMSTSVGTAYTELTVDGLAKYSQTFIIRKDDGKGNTTDLATFTEGYENLAYGSTVEFNKYTIPTINDGSTLTGLPMYAVYKWVKTVNGVEQKLAATDVQISDVVKGETTYICYVLDFKATDETQKTTRVRYLDKSGNTIEFDTATVGEPYTRKETSIAPLIPYYNCTGWELVFGDETNVGTRELVYRAIYTFNETEANRCTIVGLPGVYVNGTTGTPGYKAYYDEKIELTGAEKYAYANADGSIIAPINENYIFAPHLNGVDKTIYITKVETPITEAKSIITGVFTTHEDTTYNYLVINAQYYLPEGAKAVEAGAVIGKYNNADTLKIGSAVKVVSDTQGDNHEYSLQMSYSKNKTGTLYARSYLIYVDSNGDTQTVYSDDITTCNLD